MIDFEEPALIAAVQGRADSLRWRVALGAVFAMGAGLVLHDGAVAGAWYAVLWLAMSADAMIGRRYAGASGREARRLYGWASIGCTFVTLVWYTSIVVYVGVHGGDSGRLLSVLMAASSLAATALFLHRAIIFSVVTVAPSTLWLVAAPFVPVQGGGAFDLQGAIGASLGVAGLIAYAVRASLNNKKMMDSLERAGALAQRRRVEAEEKRAEAERASRAKTDFMTTMTHELRTPLNAVIGYSEIIAEDVGIDGREDLVADANRISAAARHLLGLIDQVLRLSASEATGENLNLSETDVGALLRSVIEAQNAEAEAKKVRITARLGAGLDAIVTDGERLRLCMYQLTDNAVKFTAKGQVTVTASRTEEEGRDWLCIAVSDTGIGMSAEQAAKVFQPFMQADASKTREHGGLGLGLSIAQRAARSLGGDIAVESTLGRGSTFTFRMPLAPEATASAARVGEAA